MTKKSTTPKLGQKQLKSPIKGAASIPNKSIGDEEDGEDKEGTVTENPFADVNNGSDSTPARFPPLSSQLTRPRFPEAG